MWRLVWLLSKVAMPFKPWVVSSDKAKMTPEAGPGIGEDALKFVFVDEKNFWCITPVVCEACCLYYYFLL